MNFWIFTYLGEDFHDQSAAAVPDARDSCHLGLISLFAQKRPISPRYVKRARDAT